MLGASIQTLTGLLSRDLLKLVGIACLIAFPMAWYITDLWLQEYVYRVAVAWWQFAAIGAAAILLATITVCVQTIKAAAANPVKSLRSE